MLSAVKPATPLTILLALALAVCAQRRGTPPIEPKPEELAQIREKSERIEALVQELKSKHADPDLVGDVEVYAKAGRILLEFPELVVTQAAIDHAMVVLDQGIDRARQLSA